MNRRAWRAVSLLVGAVAVVAPLFAAEGGTAAKVARVGILRAGTPATDAFLEPFRQGLHDLGYREGENIALEVRWAEGNSDRLPDLAGELVRLKVDVIVTGGTAGIQAAKQATGVIPIVMSAHGSAVEAGFVVSLARPGGNITGLSFMNPELTAKRFEVLKELVPRVSRVVGLWDPTSARDQVEEAKRAAEALRLQLAIVEARGRTDLDSAFSAAKKERAQALSVLSSPIFMAHRQLLTALAAKNQLPAMYDGSHFVASGGLVSYGANFPDLYRRSAVYVDKILKGAKPADLPVEQPTRFEMVINLKTAKALGLTIPQSILIRADQVIQ